MPGGLTSTALSSAYSTAKPGLRLPLGSERRSPASDLRSDLGRSLYACHPRPVNGYPALQHHQLAVMYHPRPVHRSAPSSGLPGTWPRGAGGRAGLRKVRGGSADGDGQNGLPVVAVRSGCAVGASSADEQGRSVLCGGSRQRRKGWRQRFFWGKSWHSHLWGLESTIGVVNEARDRAIWERSDYGRFGWVTDPEGNRLELWEPR
jgi:hypothetical protein